jgi:hypothetical protein
LSVTVKNYIEASKGRYLFSFCSRDRGDITSLNIGQQVDVLVSHLDWWMALLPLPFLISSLWDVAGWRQLLPKNAQVRFASLLTIQVGSEAVLQSVPGGFALSDALKTLLLKRLFKVMPCDTLGSLIMRHWMIGLAEIIYILVALLLGLAGRRQLFEGILEQQTAFSTCIGLLVCFSLVLTFVVYKLRQGSLASSSWSLLHRVPLRSTRKWLEARQKSFENADAHFKFAARKSRWTLLFALVAYFLVWSMETVETLLVAHSVGLSLRFADAFLLEAFLAALKLAVFFLPSGIGAKDLGYFLLIGALGVRTTTMQIGLFVVLKRMVYFFWLIAGYVILLGQGIRPLAKPAILKTTIVETP